MTSSTARSEHIRATAIIAGAVLAMVLTAHAGLDAIADFAEVHLGAYLWKQEDYLRLLSPTYHDGRGSSRLLIYGPSEAREGLLPEEIDPLVSGLTAYQNAQSMGTLEDGLLMLEYLERAYGDDAIPKAILVGVTPRFLASIRVMPSPLVEGIKKYSTDFDVVEGDGPPRLVRKSRAAAAWAGLQWLAIEPDRYRRGLVAVAAPALRPYIPNISIIERRLTRPSKYLTDRVATQSEAAIRRWLVTPGNFWELVHQWDPAPDRARIVEQLHELLAILRRHGVELYVVNLPELSWNRELFRPGRYEEYVSILREGIGATPFLDLRTFLADDEFFDDAHPTWSGGIRVSRRVAAFIQDSRGGTRPK
jgi:hypothetical protein